MASIDSLYRMNPVDTAAQPEYLQEQSVFQPTGIAQEQQSQFVALAKPQDLPPSPIPDPEVAAVEYRAYRLSLDPANENTLEHLINPETGSSFTDHELSLAIRNGHLRDEIRNGEFGETPYNLSQQTNSHNSYAPSLHPTVTEQYEDFGLHAFELDALLEKEFGDKLFTPQDWIDSVPGATTLEEAFEMGGWPTMADLEGRVLVVLTGKGNGTENELGEYVGGAQGAGSRAAFIASEPEVTPVEVRPEWVIPLEDGQVDLRPPVTVGGGTFLTRRRIFTTLIPSVTLTQSTKAGMRPDSGDWATRPILMRLVRRDQRLRQRFRRSTGIRLVGFERSRE